MALAKYIFNPGDTLPAINVNSIDPDNINNQTFGKLVGGTDVVLANFETLFYGDNDGAVKIDIDGVEYDNIEITTTPFGAEGVIESNVPGSNFTTSESLTKQFSSKVKITKFSYYRGNTVTGTQTGYLEIRLNDTDGALIATSDTITLPNSVGSEAEFVFSGGEIVLLEENQNYFFKLVPTSGSYSKSSPSSSGTPYYKVFGFQSLITDISLSNIATLLQASIRTATSGQETVQYVTDHFEVNSGTFGVASSVLKFEAPTTGTDISGAGYLDLGANATETQGVGEEYRLVRLGSDGLLPNQISARDLQVYLGDGSDGDVVISSNTTLTEDKYYNNLTINSGVVLNTGGYRIFVRGTLLNNGTISRNGNNGENGGNATSGEAGTGGAGGSALATTNLYGGVAGKTGANGVYLTGGSSNGTAGTSGESRNPSTTGVNGVAGGQGGDGSGISRTGGAGGGAGTATIETVSYILSANKLMTLDTENEIIIPLFFLSGATSNLVLASSAGSGSGGSGCLSVTSPQVAGSGGGGGSGGNAGIIYISARFIENNGTISAIGGNGGNGGNGYSGGASANVAGSGGGGGGNGGLIILAYQEIIAEGTVSVAGGTGGLGSAKIQGVSEVSNGSNGSNGNSGKFIKIKL